MNFIQSGNSLIKELELPWNVRYLRFSGNVAEDSGILGCDISLGCWFPTFRSAILPSPPRSWRRREYQELVY